MNTFRQALQGSAFTVTAEISGPGETPVDEVLRQAEALATSVDGIQLAESGPGRARIAPLALASLLIGNGIDPIPGISCRDRNRIALQSDLLGLRALGVTGLILDEGRQMPAGPDPWAKPVFDVGCRELVAMASALNEEEWANAEHEFLIGTSAAAFDPPGGWDAGPLPALASAGARFVQIRPCFDSGVLRGYMQRLVEAKMTWSYSVIVTLAPLLSAKAACWLLEKAEGALVPPALVESLDNSASPEKDGIELCAGLMRAYAAIPGISGVNLLTLGNPEAVRAVIDESGIRSE